MDITALLSAGVAVVVLAVLYMSWSIYRSGNRPETLGEWAQQAQAAEQWAQQAVKAAEQLWESGQIESSQRYKYADDFLAETLPNLDAGQRQMIIESAVWLLKRAKESEMWHVMGRPQTGPGEWGT